jgi:hypothetical protein
LDISKVLRRTKSRVRYGDASRVFGWMIETHGQMIAAEHRSDSILGGDARVAVRSSTAL